MTEPARPRPFSNQFKTDAARRSDRYLFAGLAVWFLLITFWGFSESFYLNQDPEELAFHLKLHGVLFSGWILLFLVQTSLISLNRIRIHKRLGILGLILIIAMIPVGFYPILYKVSIGTKTIDAGGFNLFTLSMGYLFVFLGLRFRKKPYYHKRFMLFAMLVFATAAVDRVALFLDLEQSQLFRKGLVLFPAAALFVVDYVRFRSPHWFDLLPVASVLAIFFLSDYVWLSPLGRSAMDLFLKFV